MGHSARDTILQYISWQLKHFYYDRDITMNNLMNNLTLPLSIIIGASVYPAHGYTFETFISMQTKHFTNQREMVEIRWLFTGIGIKKLEKQTDVNTLSFHFQFF